MLLMPAGRWRRRQGERDPKGTVKGRSVVDATHEQTTGSLMDTFTAIVSWPSAPLTASLVQKSLSSLDPLPAIVQHLPSSTKNGVLQWATYDEIDHELTNSHDHHTDVLSSSYTFRKALTRKHFLSRTIHSYLTKNPDSVLGRAVPKTFELEISFADELDEILADDLWDLSVILDVDPCRWWILKPFSTFLSYRDTQVSNLSSGMADRGNGIRLFNSKSSLLQIFESFEREQSDDEDEDDTAVITSQLRHFVIQVRTCMYASCVTNSIRNISPIRY